MARKLYALLALLVVVLGLFQANQGVALAQSPIRWTEPAFIPYIDANTEAPFLLADPNGTIHAFSAQKVGSYEYVIVYNYWTRTSGWSKPVDVLLSPLFDEAHAPAAYLDKQGIIHVVFYGGHDVRANIYYSSAPAAQAANAAAWLPPVAIATSARPPITTWIAADGDENFYVLFGGDAEGTGIYATNSVDGGANWSLPELVSATYSDTLWPYAVRMYYGESGRLYAVWNILNRRAWGTTLLLSTFDFSMGRWNEPTVVAEGVANGILGVQSPSLIEYGGELFVMYDNGIPDQGVVRLVRRSNDGGRTWTEAIRPFPGHVGGNGAAGFVVDSSNNLRVFFGQRTNTAFATQIHGMWYSEWHPETGSWGGVSDIVSGPLVQDIDGKNGFDPSAARAITSLGNLLMVVWRTDPGNGANGAWYSYTELDAPTYAAVPLPTPAPVAPLVGLLTPPAAVTNTLALEAAAPPVIATQATPAVKQLANPAMPLFVGLAPVGLFLLYIAYRQNQRR